MSNNTCVKVISDIVIMESVDKQEGLNLRCIEPVRNSVNSIIQNEGYPGLQKKRLGSKSDELTV